MRKAIIICAAICFSTSSSAFNLNPLNRNSERPSSGNGFLDLVSEDVHERITKRARDIYLKECENQKDRYGCDYEHKLSIGKVIQDSLIRGVWWNDDPNQNLYKGRQAIWLGHMKGASSRAKRGIEIDGSYIMHYRSHYGDLQFLHSMASNDGESPEATKAKILMWAEFVYKISTGEIKRGTTFSQVNLGGLEKYFKRQANWEINWVLQPRYRLVETPNDFEEHSLGTLLHMLEDSYSDAHASRDYQPTSKCKLGRVVSFHSYIHQDPSRHGKADTWKGYQTVTYPENSSPEYVAARIISFSHKKASWEQEVRPYLDETVYCIDGEQEASGPGRY